MEAHPTSVKSWLQAMGFSPANGKNGLWRKDYAAHGPYRIAVELLVDDPTGCRIDYGPRIRRGRSTAGPAERKENLVRLECVNRLLEIGYAPGHIELDPYGRGNAGLDIGVRDAGGCGYLLIDCRAWGKPYNNALQTMVQNDYKKDQLFHYYLLDTNVQYVCLYTSAPDGDDGLKYNTGIVAMAPFRGCGSPSEIYERWDKIFQSKGLFEDDAAPYRVRFTGIKKAELKPLEQADVDESDGTLFNTFAEILRRHVISDKNNAYNVIFNLILCKIVDEDTVAGPDEEMGFQWKEGETAEEVLERLSALYQTGVTAYLGIALTDFADSQLDAELERLPASPPDAAAGIKALFRRFKLYKSNEFAFKEILDERTFRDNARIVKAVVKLLERFRFKEPSKQPFLGDFFERLLNIGVKQEAGQFFTPIPVAAYNCMAIPFEAVMARKIAAGEELFLPYTIDYACGSGHFLTEALRRVGRLVAACRPEELRTQEQRDRLAVWQTANGWAREFVYGIEKDFRLVKTSKVACFLHGDGGANVLYADGLAGFDSPTFHGRLRADGPAADHPQFDVLIANPPYSVENFKYTMKDGERCFELFPHVTDKSDNIECLFIERAKQLLVPGGFAAIILPSSLLLNQGIHQKARELLLKYFRIVGIVEFGNQTFAATGQRTVNLHLERRANDEWQRAAAAAHAFLDGLATGDEPRELIWNGRGGVFAAYCAAAHADRAPDAYRTALAAEAFREREAVRLMYFMLARDQPVVIAHSREGDEEKLFLGYEHSDRKKYEGIHPYPHTADKKIVSVLHDELRTDHPDKISTYMYANFLGRPLPPVGENLAKHLDVRPLHDLLDLASEDFKARVFIDSLDNIYAPVTAYELVSLADSSVAEVLDHLRKPVKKSNRTSGVYPYYGASGKAGLIDAYLFDEDLVLIGEDGAKWSEYEHTAYAISGKSWVNNHAHVIRVNKKRLLEAYLVAVFNRLDFSYLKRRPNGGKLLKSELVSIKFPLPPLEQQRAIVAEMERAPAGRARYEALDRRLGIAGAEGAPTEQRKERRR